MSRWTPAQDEALLQLRRLPRLGFTLCQIPDNDGCGPWALHYSRQLQWVMEGVYVHSDYATWAYRSSMTDVDPEQPWIFDPATALWSESGDAAWVISALLNLPPPRPPARPAWPITRSTSAPGHPDASPWSGAYHAPG